MHHHTADHYVTVVSGTITLTVDGKDHKLGPGSYFELTQKKASRGKSRRQRGRRCSSSRRKKAWDVVMEK